MDDLIFISFLLNTLPKIYFRDSVFQIVYCEEIRVFKAGVT